MKKFIIAILVVFFSVVIAAIFALGYFGLVPGLSNVMVKQKDLKVGNDPQLAIELDKKIGFENTYYLNEEPVEGELEYSGQINIDESLSSEQVTSVINNWTKWAAAPYENAQVKINDDGSVELSTTVDVEKAKSFALRLGYSQKDIDTASEYVAILSNKVPVYAKANASVSNNVVSIETSQILVGNIPIPGNIFSVANSFLEEAAQRRLNQLPNTNIERLDFKGGKLNIKGTIPQKGEVR